MNVFLSLVLLVIKIFRAFPLRDVLDKLQELPFFIETQKTRIRTTKKFSVHILLQIFQAKILASVVKIHVRNLHRKDSRIWHTLKKFMIYISWINLSAFFWVIIRIQQIVYQSSLNPKGLFEVEVVIYFLRIFHWVN